MTDHFDKHKWIFEADGSLLDIYVQETTIADWLTLIDFLNANYKLKYGSTGINETDDQINKDYVKKLFTEQDG